MCKPPRRSYASAMEEVVVEKPPRQSYVNVMEETESPKVVAASMSEGEDSFSESESVESGFGPARRLPEHIRQARRDMAGQAALQPVIGQFMDMELAQE